MAREADLVLGGLIDEIFPEGRFGVHLENGHRIIACTAGRMRRGRIRTVVDDSVQGGMTPFGLEKAGSPIEITLQIRAFDRTDACDADHDKNEGAGVHAGSPRVNLCNETISFMADGLLAETRRRSAPPCPSSRPVRCRPPSCANWSPR